MFSACGLGLNGAQKMGKLQECCTECTSHCSFPNNIQFRISLLSSGQTKSSFNLSKQFPNPFLYHTWPPDKLHNVKSHQNHFYPSTETEPCETND